MQKFLEFWQQTKYEDACALVAEPVRKAFEADMKKKPLVLLSLDEINLFERRGHLIAKAHASVEPTADRKDLKSARIGIDMVLQDGKWWVTVR